MSDEAVRWHANVHVWQGVRSEMAHAVTPDRRRSLCGHWWLPAGVAFEAGAERPPERETPWRRVCRHCLRALGVVGLPPRPRGPVRERVRDPEPEGPPAPAPVRWQWNRSGKRRIAHAVGRDGVAVCRYWHLPPGVSFEDGAREPPAEEEETGRRRACRYCLRKLGLPPRARPQHVDRAPRERRHWYDGMEVSTRRGRAEVRRTHMRELAGWVGRLHGPALDGPYTASIVGPSMDRLFDWWAAFVEVGGPVEGLREAVTEVMDAWKRAHAAALSREPWRPAGSGTRPVR